MLPAVASLPLLMAYGGTTDVVVPSLVVPYVGSAIVNLGPMYAPGAVLDSYARACVRVCVGVCLEDRN